MDWRAVPGFAPGDTPRPSGAKNPASTPRMTPTRRKRATLVFCQRPG